MSFTQPGERHHKDTAPGDQRLDGADAGEGITSYLIGLGLATILTITSFFISGTNLVWGPSIPVALVVLAIAQMGVHLVFFLNITTGPDNTNNVMALAFGVLIVLLLLTGSLWIMAHLNQNMGLMDRAMQMHRDRGDGSRVVTTTGLVRRTATEPVFAGVTGEIKEIRCNANMRVKAGALCAKIDPDPYQVALDRRKADLASAEARLEKDKAAVLSAKAAFEGKGALFNSRSISKRAFDKARESLEAAQREYDRNEAHAADLKLAVQSAETNFRLTDIVAPIDGTVITRNVNLGEKVALNSKTPLFVIATDGGLVEIGAAIIGEDSKALKLGGKVSVTINGLPDHTLPGVVTQIRRAAETEVPGDSADVLINVTDPDHLLEPGMAATISIVTE